jgi:hypothetical protein
MPSLLLLSVFLATAMLQTPRTVYGRNLTGAGVRLSCGEQIIRVLLVFRPGGGPIYRLRLETNPTHEAEDSAFFENVASSFRIKTSC